jgi:hypothetical protein
MIVADRRYFSKTWRGFDIEAGPMPTPKRYVVLPHYGGQNQLQLRKWTKYLGASTLACSHLGYYSRGSSREKRYSDPTAMKVIAFRRHSLRSVSAEIARYPEASSVLRRAPLDFLLHLP